MTKAKITKPNGYDCAPAGHTIVHFPCGAIVEGQVAEWALQDRAAQRILDKRKGRKITGPKERKK